MAFLVTWLRLTLSHTFLKKIPKIVYPQQRLAHFALFKTLTYAQEKNFSFPGVIYTPHPLSIFLQIELYKKMNSIFHIFHNKIGCCLDILFKFIPVTYGYVISTLVAFILIFLSVSPL